MTKLYVKSMGVHCLPTRNEEYCAKHRESRGTKIENDYKPVGYLAKKRVLILSICPFRIFSRQIPVVACLMMQICHHSCASLD